MAAGEAFEEQRASPDLGALSFEERVGIVAARLKFTALRQNACRDGRSALNRRVPRLFEALALAHGDGRHARLLISLARVDLLILDRWGLQVLNKG